MIQSASVGRQSSLRATRKRQRTASCSFKMISFANINKQYCKQLLFVDAWFQLNPGEKVGLVGPNGAGKTTHPPPSTHQIFALPDGGWRGNSRRWLGLSSQEDDDRLLSTGRSRRCRGVRFRMKRS